MAERFTIPKFNADVIFAAMLCGVLIILLLPMPPMLLSFLLVVNISIALFILMLMFYLDDALNFSSFPALLLMLTLFRLSLNVATTKLILLDGYAGEVISAFGRVVVGNNFIVGIIVFAVIVLIQFVVVTRGASRIAEVGARFTLDAMPGKQMSIDADLNAGLIDEHEAKYRRERLSEEADFYGAMDGASKFVKGDAIAGLIIIGVNVVGGLLIGTVQQDMAIGEALQTYTILTIGDGLVTQVPALIISISAGMLTTKAAVNEGMGGHISRELLRRPEPLFVCGITLIVFAVLPGFPFAPFFILGGAALTGAVAVTRYLPQVEEKQAGASGAGGGGAATAVEGGDSSGQNALGEGETTQQLAPTVSPMTLEIGFGLVPLVDRELEGDLVDRISNIRDDVREELGFLIPPISIQDNLTLGNNEYRILVRGLERERGTVYPGMSLAIDPGDVTGSLDGTPAKDPAYGLEAYWINPQRTEAAEAKGYTVADSASVITTHVTKIVNESADELLSRQQVNDLLDMVKETDQVVVNELTPQRMSVGVIHRVLQQLLREQVPLHDLPVILETLSDYADQTKDPATLCEFCRDALKGHILSTCMAHDATLYALIFDPAVDETLQYMLGGENGSGESMTPQQLEEVTKAVENRYSETQVPGDGTLVLLTSPKIRLHMRRLIEKRLPDMPVLAYGEVSDDVNLQVLGTIEVESLMAQPQQMQEEI